MTADPSTPAAGREPRLLELAKRAAGMNHCRWKEGTKKFKASGHNGGLLDCEHPDCVLVRSALPALVEESALTEEIINAVDECLEGPAREVARKNIERLLQEMRLANQLVGDEVAASAEGREQALNPLLLHSARALAQGVLASKQNVGLNLTSIAHRLLLQLDAALQEAGAAPADRKPQIGSVPYISPERLAEITVEEMAGAAPASAEDTKHGIRQDGPTEVQREMPDVQDATRNRHRAVRGDGALLSKVPEEREDATDSASEGRLSTAVASAPLVSPQGKKWTRRDINEALEAIESRPNRESSPQGEE